MLRNRYFCNIIFSCIPDTRFFSLKRRILKYFDVNVQDSARVTGGLKIYGRGDIFIGRDTWVGLNTHIYLAPTSKVYIGDFCDIAPEVVFHTGSHSIGGSGRRAGEGTGENIYIGDGSWVGTGTTIIAGCTLGSGAIVGAKTLLLNKVYPGNCLIAGVPGKVIRALS